MKLLRTIFLFGFSAVFSALVLRVFGLHLFSPTVSIQEFIFGVLFLFLNGVGAFVLCCQIVGFILLRNSQRKRATDHIGNLTSQTAIVMPVYNEDPQRVRWGAQKIWRGIQDSGIANNCEYFILSDSDNASIITIENDVYGSLPFAEVIRRPDRSDYKSGNIAAFLESRGHNYDYLLVLDADSLMVDDSIRRLIIRMDADPHLGILQSMVLPVRTETLFARGMAFSLWRVTPLFLSGLYWAMGPQSVYWGHNALIRVAPFMKHCRLPILPGKPPFGGRILSQDIVEAMLMARGGWNVEWDLHIGDSFDEIPATIFDYAKRDHRWCQGNFQHFWLAFANGVPLAYRLYFLYGIYSYASSPLMLLLMVFGFVATLQSGIKVIGPLILFNLILNIPTLQLLPKLLGCFFLPLPGNGWWQKLGALAMDIMLGLLSAPILLFCHTRSVIAILLGRQITWVAPSRNPRLGVPYSESIKQLWIPTLLAFVWGVMIVCSAPMFLVYTGLTLPVWALSIPISVALHSDRVARIWNACNFTRSFFSPVATNNRHY